MAIECCGMHLYCEKTGQYNGPEPTDYYEDEELDLFQGRDSADYTDEEIEQFREVLYTMRQDEVPNWLGSMQIRGVMIPDELKSEVAMIVNG